MSDDDQVAAADRGAALAVHDPPVDGSVDDRVDQADDDGGRDSGAPEDGPVDEHPQLPLATELARVTGLLLLVLLPIHLTTVLLADPTDVDRLLDRWDDRWWLLADWGFLTVGVSHALFSLRERMHRLGSGSEVSSACPHCGGVLPAPDDRFGVLAFRLLVGLTVVLYLAASWAMLRLV